MTSAFFNDNVHLPIVSRLDVGYVGLQTILYSVDD